MATISTRIAIEGGDEIKRQLQDLGKAVQEAFKTIADLADKAKIDPATQKSFDDLAEAGKTLGAQFADLGKAASEAAPEIEGVGKAAGTAGEAIMSVGDASKAATANLTETGAAAKKSGEGYANLALNVVKAGAAVVSAGSSITAAGAATATATASVVTAAASVGTFALALGNTLVPIIGVAVTAIGTLGSALARMATSDAKLSDTLEHVARGTADIGQSFTALQIGQAAFQQMGVSGERFRDIIAKIAEALGSFDAGDAIKKSADAITAAADKALLAEKALLEAKVRLDAAGGKRSTFDDAMRLVDINQQLAKQTTDLAVAQKAADDAATASSAAQDAKAKALANNLADIVKLIQQVEAGQKNIKFDDLVEAGTKIDAVKARLKDVVKAGGDVSQALTKIIASLPQKDALAVGKALGFTETDIDRVRRYGTEVGKIDGLFQRIQAAGVLISPEAAATFDAMADASQRLDSAWARLKQAWDSAIFSQLGAAAVTAFDNMASAVVEFAAKAVETFNNIVTGWGIILSKIGELISQAAQGWGIIISTFVTTPAANAWAWISQTFNDAMASLGSAITSAYQSVVSFVTTPVANAWQWIKDAFNAVIAGLFGGSPAAPDSGGSGFASGGVIGGRGTGTSDSNLAWVSRGEYITPARAVAQPGVLAFLEALRLTGGDLRSALHGMRGFAVGGLVMPRLAIPAFAGGGGMNSVTINFPGLPEITGLRAPSNVVDQLRHAAALAQVRSGGRKPSRYS